MSASSLDDKWAAGEAYEAFMGRWSRRLAERSVEWLGVEHDLTWLDVGCGTGALAAAICSVTNPASVVACDPSGSFVEHATVRMSDPRFRSWSPGPVSFPRIQVGSTGWCRVSC